jgi:autotransporter-associated beta strand protein
MTGNLNYDRGAFGYLAAQSSGFVLDGGTFQHTGTSNPKTADGAGRLFTIGAAGATLDSASAGKAFAIGYRYDYSTALTSSAGGTLELTGAGDGELNYALPGSGGLVKNGTGVWTLSGQNTYSGPTVVNAGALMVAGRIANSATTVNPGGTLAGDGSLGGPVVIESGGRLAAGTLAIGRLTISNNLALMPGSTTLVELNRTAATNDTIVVTGMANYGGRLAVTNLGGTPGGGDRFRLFNSAGSTGDFADIAGTPGPNLGWKFLPTTGELLVSATTQVALVMTVTNGLTQLQWPADHTGWTLQAQTNSLATGIGTNWIAVAGSVLTNVVTVPFSGDHPMVLFRLTFP